MSAFAANWDSPSDYSGPSISGELSTGGPHEPQTGKGRRARRVAVALGAGLRQRGASGVSVLIEDLSTDGFRVATHLDVPAGTDVWLRLPGLESCHARVMWSESNHIGCAFVRPLHPAVLKMVVAKSSRS
jgi:hypothetical protein